MDDDANSEVNEDGSVNIDPSKIGNASCVTKFVKTLLSLVCLQFRLIATVKSTFLDGTWGKSAFKTLD